QWQVRIAVLLIFAMGFAAGALSWNIYRSRHSFTRPDGDRFDQVLDRLQLTAEQRAQVDQILSDARSRLIELRKQSEPGRQEIRQQTDQRLQSVLTPDQWEQFRQARETMRGRRRDRGL
ncbi:MAG TPA: periplasmic heavy metal sensor, partial [Blastocatellia bacterium]|nr:periplasmic heavy metal sensor [Blastocatellia bacterium]